MARPRPEIRVSTGSGRGAIQRWSSGGWLLLLAVAWFGASAAKTRAQERPSLEGVLSVEADPQGCIAEPRLRARVLRWLRSTQQQLPAGLQLRVAIDPLRYVVERAGQVVAERRFDGLPANCDDRLDALAVAIAVALDHLAGIEAETAPADVPEPMPVPEPESGPDSESPPEPEPDRGPSVALFARGGALFEPLPEPVFGFGAGVELGVFGVQLALMAIASAETDTALAGGRSEAQLVGAQLHGCVPWAVRDLELAGCIGCAGGAVLARGRGYSPGRFTAMGWIAPLLRLSARYPSHGWLSARLAVEGLINVLRPEPQVRGGTTAEAPAGLFGAAGSVELVIALP